MSQNRRVTVVLLLLATIAVGLALYKIAFAGYSIVSVMPRTQRIVTLHLELDGHGGDISVRTFLPDNDARQQISTEQGESPHLHLTSSAAGLNRVAIWTGAGVPDEVEISYELAVLSRPVHFVIARELTVPASYPASIAPYLRPEPEIQVDATEIRLALDSIAATRGSVTSRLRRIYDYTAAMKQRPFKGTTDALTALRLGEASCNGKSRLFVAFARATGIPARLVGGLVMSGGSKRVSHQWVEAYIGGHWVPFDPTNRHFAELPERYLTLYYGDQSLFRHTRDINFEYRFDVTTTLVPSERSRTVLGAFNVWAMFERLDLPFSLLRTVLLLPIGALIVVLFRNVIGMPTYGTFLPALIAAAASETGLAWGLVGLLVLVAVLASMRWAVRRLDLLHSPTLAILLATVTVTMLGLTMLAEQLDIAHLTRITLFPIAVMAITAERFYLTLAEQGLRDAAKFFAGTCVVIAACYVVMSSLALQIIVIAFPEVLLFVVALDLYLGRWVGMRLSEYLRFRALLSPGGGQP